MCIRVSDVGCIFDGFARVPLLDIEVYFRADKEYKHTDIEPEHSADYGRKAAVKY